MFDKLLNSIWDENGDLKFSVWCVVVITCIILTGLVEGM